MYNVVVTPEVTDILIGYAQKCAIDNGIECATNLVDSFDKAINSLETLPKRGIKKLQYIPAKKKWKTSISLEHNGAVGSV